MKNSTGAAVGTAAGGTLAMTGTGLSPGWLAAVAVTAIVVGFLLARQAGKRSTTQP